MSATAFIILCFAVFGVLYGGVVIITRRDARIREQFELDTEPAFEVELEYPNLPQELVEAIRPSVDRVGVVRGLGEIRDAQGRKREVQKWEIYLLDVNGCFHDVTKIIDDAHAAQVALELAELFDVPLDDPEFITAGR